MGVKVQDFISGMLILYSFRTYSLPSPTVECHEEMTARLPKFRHGGGAPHHTIHLNMTSHILLRHIDVELPIYIIIYTAHKRATKSKNTSTNRLMATAFKLTNFQKHTAAAATTTITVE